MNSVPYYPFPTASDPQPARPKILPTRRGGCNALSASPHAPCTLSAASKLGPCSWRSCFRACYRCSLAFSATSASNATPGPQAAKRCKPRPAPRSTHSSPSSPPHRGVLRSNRVFPTLTLCPSFERPFLLPPLQIFFQMLCENRPLTCASDAPPVLQTSRRKIPTSQCPGQSPPHVPPQRDRTHLGRGRWLCLFSVPPGLQRWVVHREIHRLP